MKKIVFVCTGNTCRSPMAKAILAQILEQSNCEMIEVLSAGLNTVNGLPASPQAIETMLNEGIDISKHQSRQLDPELIYTADYILTMTSAQRNYLQGKYPEKASRIYTISDFSGKNNEDIADPFGRGLSAYQECVQELKELLPGVLSNLIGTNYPYQESKIKVAIGSDHAGFELKQEIIKVLVDEDFEVLDCGSYSNESVDYPDIAEKVAAKVLAHKIRGIIICGTGIGISIAANKIPGIRAALCYNLDTARLARQHNDANIVAFGARQLEPAMAIGIVKTFLTTEFEAGRHQNRIDKIKELEKKSGGRSN